MVRLLALDIDGTLLNSAGQLTPRVRAALGKAEEAGCLIALATGRRLWAIQEIVETLRIRVPVIIYGGAMTYDVPGQRVVAYTPLEPNIVREIIALSRKHRVQPGVYQNPLYGGEHVFLGPEWYDTPSARLYATVRPKRVIRYSSYHELCQVPQPLIITVLEEEAQVRILHALFREQLSCHLTMGAYRVGDHPCYSVDITSAGCNKARALADLARSYDLKLTDVMAIGDGFNDLEMIAEAGLGVAMGNAPPEVQAVARAVVGTNDEDGVAEAIERFI